MAISNRNRFHRVWQAFVNGEYTLCVTNEIIEEYVEVIGRNISERAAEAVVYNSREHIIRMPFLGCRCRWGAGCVLTHI